MEVYQAEMDYLVVMVAEVLEVALVLDQMMAVILDQEAVEVMELMLAECMAALVHNTTLLDQTLIMLAEVVAVNTLAMLFLLEVLAVVVKELAVAALMDTIHLVKQILAVVAEAVLVLVLDQASLEDLA